MKLSLETTQVRCSRGAPDPVKLVAAAASRASTRATAAAALARLVAIPAENRTIATRLERHCCRLAATRTNHRRRLCRSRTVAGTPLVVLLCHTAILATFWGRIAAFLKERLISSGEGEVLPTIAASKLNISGHGSPRGDCTAPSHFCTPGFFCKLNSCQGSETPGRGKRSLNLLSLQDADPDAIARAKAFEIPIVACRVPRAIIVAPEF